MGALVESSYKNGCQHIRVLHDIDRESDLADVGSTIQRSLEEGRRNIVLSFTSNSTPHGKPTGYLVLYSEMVQRHGGTLSIVAPNEAFLDVLHTMVSACQIRVYRSEEELEEELSGE